MHPVVDLTLDDDDDRPPQRHSNGFARKSSNISTFTSRSSRVNYQQRPPQYLTISDSDDEVHKPTIPRPTFASRAPVSPPTKADSPKSFGARNIQTSIPSNSPKTPYIDSKVTERVSPGRLIEPQSPYLGSRSVVGSAVSSMEKGPPSGEPDTSVGAAGDNPVATFPATSNAPSTGIRNSTEVVPEDDRTPGDHPMADTIEQPTKPDVPMVEMPRDASNLTPLYQQTIDTIEQPLKDLAMESQQPQWIGEDFTFCLQNYLKEMRDDHESMTKIWLGKASAQRRPTFPPLNSPLESDNPNGYMGIKYTSDPFAKIKPIQKLQLSTHDPVPNGPSVRRFEGETFTASGRSNGKYAMTAPVTTWKDDTPEVPDYMQYTNITRNVLGINTRQLRVWPYCGDEVADSSKFYENIRPEFDTVVDALPRKILWSQQASTYSAYFEAFLEEVGCSMDSILAYLLDRDDEEVIRTRLLRVAETAQIPPKHNIKAKVNSLLTTRAKACKEDFDRSSERWIRVYSSLSPLDDEALWKAAWAVYVFWSETKFSAWQIARKFANVTDSESDEDGEKNDTTYSDIACRICHQHDCPYHGEIRERRDSEDDMAHFTAIDRLDVDHPPRINFKYRVTAPESLEGDKSVKAPAKEKNFSWWMSETHTWDHNERGPFFACDHPGKSCDQAECSCYTDKVCCEKICGCSKDCGRRFKGCSCKQGKRRKICAQEESCECFKMNRECDPDLCGGCGVHVILDPANRYDEDIQKNKCQNAAIQLGLPKRTILGDSRVHGFGLYSGEAIKENEFVGEYAGEMITKEETERRGVIYREQNQSYLFNLNRDQEIDSQRLGNKIRFINHAQKTSRLRNLAPRIFLCNMVQRIGMFAIKDIAIGQELFFDYGKDYHETLIDGSKKEKKKGGKVVSKSHNTSLVNNLPDPETTLGRNGNAAEDAYDDADDDIPLVKRPRLNEKQPGQLTRPTFTLKTARKTQDQAPPPKPAPSKLLIRNTKAAIKSAPSKGPSRPRMEQVPVTPLETAARKDEEFEVANESSSDGSDYSMKDAEEEEESENESEEEEPEKPRRSGRKRKLSRRVRDD